ncbi:MAG: hypothetical protein RI953_223 [Pseudomonadota bacterium]|jgi:hypothetical protein
MHDLLHLMYQDGHLSSTELTALRRTSRQLGENPVRVLRSLNVATPSEIKDLLQRYYGFSAATDKVIEELDDSLRALIPADIALHYCVLAIAQDKNELYVLTEDPTDKGTISQLEFFLGKKIVPVIATVQQLSNGLCRLYGVEPGRLNLSGLLEASRGAVGTSASHSRKEVMLIDDSQPLLDDEEFKRLKIKPRKIEKKKPEPEIKAPVQPSPPESSIVIDPAMAAAVNLLGLRLALARNRSEAAAMATERLKDFGVELSMSEDGKLQISWSGNQLAVDLANHSSDKEIPQTLKAVVKKIAQCQA